MVSLGFALLLSIFLTFCGSSPAIAAPSLSAAPTAEIAMAKKPLFSFSGKRPTTLGVTAGKLLACPDTPNCVCSQALDTDKEHKVDAIAYSSTPAEAMAKLKSVVESFELAEVITADEDYLYAEFTTPLMGFVDDVEFYLDRSANVVQVRSASRLGKSDLGVNRQRVEAIRSKFSEIGN
ncbi:DUF1499 domain-containing protein [Phormidium tenue FACHB-886]|nr:DUF1499 domain-containing protein [Phormidium tenue FACHB-886]